MTDLVFQLQRCMLGSNYGLLSLMFLEIPTLSMEANQPKCAKVYNVDLQSNKKDEPGAAVMKQYLFDTSHISSLPCVSNNKQYESLFLHKMSPKQGTHSHL